MKRGQITLLVIVGIVLLFTVSMLLYFSRVTYTDRLQTQARETVNEFVESNSISTYVSSCLQRVATQGLKTLATQGGVLYDYQGGLTPTTGNYIVGTHYYEYYTSQGVYNLSYAIIPVSQEYCYHYFPQGPIDQTNPIYAQRWKYPVAELGLSDFSERFPSIVEPGCSSMSAPKDLEKSGYLGYSTLPFLCTPESGAEYSNIPDYLSSPILCDYPYWESQQVNLEREFPSIESQLESFVKTNLPNCFDISIYEEQGDEITVDIENSNVSIFFINPTGILIKSKFPFEISLKGQKPIVTLVDFEQTIDFNFLDTYRFIFDLTFEMARNPFFNFKEEDYLELDSYKSSFDIMYTPGECDNCNLPNSWLYDDIISITDMSTELINTPLTFYFAFKQRKPVLDYLSNPDQNFRFTTGDGEEVDVDFLFYQGETLELEPRAVDPNYDEIVLNVSGWKETTDNLLDLTCCANEPLCTITNYTDCSLNTQNYPTLDIECCRNGYPQTCNKEIIDANPLHTCFQIDNTGIPQNYEPLLFSQNMVENDGRIIYEVQPTDLGFHTLRFEVEDEHGFMDYQDVTILIYDSPLAILEPTNPYEDINDLFASIEDPYYLHADSSLASVFSQDQELSYFVYRLYDVNGRMFELSSTEYALELPNESYTIENISQKIFNRTRFYETLLPQENNLPIELGLQVEQDIQNELITSPESIVDITLSECLPYGFLNQGRSSTTFSSRDALFYYNISSYQENGLPYYSAYLDETADPFALPHVCCKPLPVPVVQPAEFNGGTYADPSILCYENPTYQTCYPPPEPQGEIAEFLNNPVINDPEGNLYPYTAENEIAFLPPSANIDTRPNVPNPYLLTDGRLGDAINDIYFLNQQQFCSGERGNVCSGKITLDWNELATIECDDDLNDVNGQYARCQGPGLPLNIADREGFVDNTGITSNIIFGSAFTTDRGSYSCQTSDATHFFNVTLACNYFSKGNSFENNIIGTDVLLSLNMQNTLVTNIDRGYCAGPYPGEIHALNTVNLNPNGPFECFATCGGMDGCNYDSAYECFCNEDNVCDDIRGNLLYAPWHAGFSCVGSTACNDVCEPNYGASKEQCYCESNPYDSSVTNTEFNTNFLGYFGDKDSDWNIINGPCCVGDGVYGIITGNNNDAADIDQNTAVCFDGVVQDSEDIFDYEENSGDQQLLSYDGHVYYCADETICADEVFTSSTIILPPPVVDQCLTIHEDGYCEYRDIVENSLCCALTPFTPCGDPLEVCDIAFYDPLLDCCADDSCFDANNNCNSQNPLTDPTTQCVDIFSSDPIVAAINDVATTDFHQYIEEAVNVGGVIGGITCTSTGWQ